MSKKKKIQLVIIGILLMLVIIIISVAIVMLPSIGIFFILNSIFQNADGYLLTGLSVGIFCCLLIVLIPTIFFFLISEKGKRIKGLKSFFCNYKICAIILIVLMLILETIFVNWTMIYYKDIQIGPQVDVLTDVIVKRKYGYKNSKETYIYGYLDDEKVHYKLNIKAKGKIERNKKYNVVRIYYYKNIGEVYDIKIYDDYER